MKKIKKPGTGVVIAVIGIIAAIVVFAFIQSQKFDVWDYITITYEGANGYARPVFSLDKDRLYKQLMGKSDDADKSYNVKMLIESIDITSDATDLSNSDKYKVDLEFDEKYEDAVGVSMGKGYKKIKAANIQKGTSIELYENVDVQFKGVSPEAVVNINNNWEDEYLSGLTFTVDKKDNISYGDVVVVTCDQSYEEIARHGYLVSDTEASYEADKLPGYVENVSQIDRSVLNNVKGEVLETIASQTQDATFHMLYKATSDTAYLRHLNNENCSDPKVTDVYFLTRNKDTGEANNYIYIMASALISDSEDEKTVYFAFSYSNNYVNVDGTFDMNHDNEEKRYVCSTDKDKLYADTVGSKADSYTVTTVK